MIAKLLADTLAKGEANRGEPRIIYWMDDALIGGDRWSRDIVTNIRSADVLLFLLTGNVYSSKYIKEREIPEAQKRARKAKWARIVPLTADAILPVIRRWEISQYQAIPIPEGSVIDCGTVEHWVRRVCDQLDPVIERVRQDRHA